MRIALVSRIVRRITAYSSKAARPDAGNPSVLSPAQTQRLLMRLRDLEWQVRGLSEQCAVLQQTASLHDWSLEALWEKVYEPRTPGSPPGTLDPTVPKKKTLN